MNIETITAIFCLLGIETMKTDRSGSGGGMALDELELVKRSKNKDRKAFNELMLAYQRRIFNIMYRFTGDYEEAKDLTQDVFIKVFKSLDSLKEDKKFKSWIIAIAANTFRNRYKYNMSRGKGRTDSIDSQIETQNGSIKVELKDNKPGADDVVHSSRIKELVQQKINLLKDEHKEVIVLRDIDGLSYEEVSTVLEISIGTVKSRIFRAREELRKQLVEVIEYF